MLKHSILDPLASVPPSLYLHCQDRALGLCSVLLSPCLLSFRCLCCCTRSQVLRGQKNLIYLSHSLLVSVRFPGHCKVSVNRNSEPYLVWWIAHLGTNKNGVKGREGKWCHFVFPSFIRSPELLPCTSAVVGDVGDIQWVRAVCLGKEKVSFQRISLRIDNNYKLTLDKKYKNNDVNDLASKQKQQIWGKEAKLKKWDHVFIPLLQFSPECGLLSWCGWVGVAEVSLMLVIFLT